MSDSFNYAVLRVVPLTEREEFFNVGVILVCPQQPFLGTRIHLDAEKLQSMAPALSIFEVQRPLDAVVEVCSGHPAAGLVAQLSQRARFHWLVAPRSTVIQISATHSGPCDEPRLALERLFREQALPRR